MIESGTPLRLRFAPSPTGSLHVGGARTALFNYLVAKRSGGAFVLRIEDTDASRNRSESEAAVIEDLHWLGLAWDEGPDVGGAYGPYRQSERGELYAEAAARLLASDAAYECFCTTQELEDEQARQKASGIFATRYSGRCAKLDVAQRAEVRVTGAAPALRFRVQPGVTVVDDVIHGSVQFDHAVLGDFVVVRSNGVPTYNFAAAYDDAKMAIDLVVRGDEHLSNTPLQLMVLAALGERAPRYAHVPLILNEDHQKLSKRHQTVGVAEYRREGYLAEALLDHLVLLGWSPGDDREHFTLSGLAEEFSLDRVGKSASVYNAMRLRAFNARALRALDRESLRALVVARFRSANLTGIADDGAWIDGFLDAYASEIHTLAEVVPLAERLCGSPPQPDEAAAEILARDHAAALLETFADAVRTAETLPPAKLIAESGKALGLPAKAAYEIVRVALTGEAHGAPLVTLFALIGRERMLERLRSALVATH